MLIGSSEHRTLRPAGASSERYQRLCGFAMWPLGSRERRQQRRAAGSAAASSQADSSGPTLPPTVVEVAAQDTVADAALDAAKKPAARREAAVQAASRERSTSSQGSATSHAGGVAASGNGNTMVARLDLASQAVRMLEEVRIIMPSVQMLAG